MPPFPSVIGRGIAALEEPPSAADAVRVRVPFHAEDGFGLLELLIAMVILNVGMLALVAAFQSGATALKRASKISSAATLAEAQMELYRALPYNQLHLDTGAVGSTDNTYRCDPSLGAACPNATTPLLTGSCATPLPENCRPTRVVSGPDQYSYRIDSYVVAYTPPPSGGISAREERKITVVVRDAVQPDKVLAREISTYDQSTAG
jgi:type II secretory pathway pseudopilin PulG